MDGNTEANPYVVIGKDEWSVATRSLDLLTGKRRITHIHFEGEHFWVTVGTGAVREFFKRVRTTRKAVPPPSSRVRRKDHAGKRARL